MAGEDNLSAALIAGWLTAAETLAVAVASKGQFAAQVLDQRLKGGLLIAVASKTSKSIGRGRVALRESPQPIPPEYWEHQIAGGFWNSGDAHFQIADARAIGPTTNIRCYDIRFDPLVIAGMFPRPEPESAPPTPATQEAPSPEPAADKKPLPPAALKAWYEAYRLAYAAHERTLEHAYTHARSAFPDKHVVRERVRELMPSGAKTGPKGPRANG